jgi:hypothetical protein
MKSSLLSFALLVSICPAQQPSGSPGLAPRQDATRYAVRGTVVNGVTGEALSDVRLSLASHADRGEQVTVISDANGHFSFANVPEGKYELAAKRRGFIPQALDQHGVFSTAVAVGMNRDAEHILFRLRPAGSISGYVLDEDNEPVTVAQVWLFKKGVSMGVAGNNFLGSTQTNDKGHYRFSNLAPGIYYLAVTAQPWYAQAQQRPMVRTGSTLQPEPQAEHSPFDVAYPLTYYNGANDFTTAAALTIAAGNSVSANIMLRAVPAVHLRLLEPPDEPRRQRNIQLFQEGPGGVRMYVNSSQTFDGTALYIGGFAPGRYQAEVRHFDPQDAKSMVGGVQTIDVTGDGTFEPRPISTGSISGNVIAERALLEEQPLFIQLRAAPNMTLVSAPISADGSLSFPGVIARPGKYEVLVAGQPDLAVQSVAATGAKATGRMVELTDSGPVELTITVSNGKQAEVNGFVLKDEKPLANALVLLLPDDNQRLSAFVPGDQSDTDGSFLIGHLIPGRYRALAIDDGADLEYTNPEVIRPYLAAAQSVTVPPGGQIKIQLAVQTRVQ